MTTSRAVSVLWKGSPSKWLLFWPVTIWLFVLFLFAVATSSYFDMLLTAHIEWMYQMQVFFKGQVMATYGVWALSAFVTLTLLIKYLKLALENYELTEDRLKFKTGILTRNYDETLLFRVVDSTIELPFFLRMVGRGNIIIYSNDPSGESGGINQSFATPDGRKGVYLSAVKDPHHIKALLDENIEQSRRRRGVRGTELM